MLNIVPFTESPPVVVPYSLLPDRVNPATGPAPRLPVNEYRLVKPVSSVPTPNTVPLPELPPPQAVPYNVFPDKIKSHHGLAPSPAPVNVYKFVKAVPSVLILNTVPLPKLPP